VLHALDAKQTGGDGGRLQLALPVVHQAVLAGPGAAQGAQQRGHVLAGDESGVALLVERQQEAGPEPAVVESGGLQLAKDAQVFRLLVLAQHGHREHRGRQVLRLDVSGVAGHGRRVAHA